MGEYDEICQFPLFKGSKNLFHTHSLRGKNGIGIQGLLQAEGMAGRRPPESWISFS